MALGRLQVALHRKGYCIGRQCLRGTMRRLGRHALQPKTFTLCTTDSTHGLLNKPTPRQANQVWVSDITYLPLANGDWAYLCAYQDMVSKQVVGWHMMGSMPEELITPPCSALFAPSRPHLTCLSTPNAAGSTTVV